MKKWFKYFEYAYLIFAALFLYDAVKEFAEGSSRAYVSSFFVLLGVGMFFFKRHFRKRYERNQSGR